MRINTNIDALNGQRNLGISAASFSKSVERLSSGLRINRAGDDAAGLTISEKLRGQVKGLNQAVRNAQDGISMIQTAEGALNESQSILQRMRELSVQAANDTLTSTDRTAIASEMNALNTEMNRIATTTQFNTKTLLAGGLNTSQSGGTLTEGTLLTTAVGVVVSDIDVSNAQGGVTYTLDKDAIAGSLTLTNGTTNVSQTVSVAAMTATNGGQVLNFSQLGVKLTLNGFNAAGTAANILADLDADTIITGASGAAVLHIGANQNQTMNVNMGDMQTTATGFGNAGGYATLNAAVTDFVSTPTQAIAENMLASIDDALADVSSQRSSLGALQNRLEHTIANLNVSSENLSASESRIRDLDMASEMVSFTRSQILQQAGTAILAQANQAPQGVLSLLR
jgi:flagellin